MIVEVLGIYEHNRGALLMLAAIKAELKRLPFGARLAVPVTMPRSSRRELGLLGVLSHKGRKARLLRHMPAWLLQCRGLVKPEDVLVILDASGFGYGDFWGTRKLQTRLLDRLETWKSGDRVAVLLPQAFGPFTSSEIKLAFAQSLELVDFAFVRDETSLRHVREVSDSATIRRAPDFTNLLHPTLKHQHEQWAGSAFIIPNEKMIAGDRSDSRDAYLRFMTLAAQVLQKSGRTPRVLVHEGAKDKALAEEINARLTEPLEIVDVASPLDTKALIAAADLIVSSRFHGLVSALAAGVPALACGWSHKYAELMGDYGSQNMMISIAEPDLWHQTLQRFLEQASASSYREKLRKAAEVQRGLSREMWTLTLNLIQSKTRRREQV